eukprot:TRINITY_DN12661_c0_g1_i1.p1 TRINITY_DN12661_c0_g1~~TRINITY_DN12661_c0_g1_i1.p1  ORF type:complete len:714 (+),score=168.53 TRINITY_DN12661_c0_g1_i1:67-2208(+)
MRVTGRGWGRATSLLPAATLAFLAVLAADRLLAERASPVPVQEFERRLASADEEDDAPVRRRRERPAEDALPRRRRRRPASSDDDVTSAPQRRRREPHAEEEEADETKTPQRRRRRPQAEEHRVDAVKPARRSSRNEAEGKRPKRRGPATPAARPARPTAAAAVERGSAQTPGGEEEPEVDDAAVDRSEHTLEWLPPAGADRPRGIVLMLADDAGWGDFGAYREAGSVTPHFDGLAARGTTFTSFYVMSPVCSASRASFLTGQLPTSRSIRTPYIYGREDANERYGQANHLNESALTVMRMLERRGWLTGHFGKWHLGGLEDAPPPSAYGIGEAAMFGSSSKTAPRLINHYPAFRVSWFPAASSRLIVDRGIDFVRKAAQRRRRFYLNLWFHTAHAPLNPTPSQMSRFPPATFCGSDSATHCPARVYASAVAEMDRQVGRLLAVVSRRRSLQNTTLLVLSSDNGPEDPSVYFNSVGSTGPFRGRKRSLYEGGIRMPFIAAWEGRVPPGKLSGEDVAAVDWLPTVAALTGAPLDSAEESEVYGRNAAEALTGGGMPERSRPLVWDFRFRMLGDCWHHSPRFALRDGHLKLLLHPDRSRVEVYNTSADPGEVRNLYHDFEAWAERSRRVLRNWSRTQAPSPRRALVLNDGCWRAGRRIARLQRRDMSTAQLTEEVEADANETLARKRRKAEKRREAGGSDRRHPPRTLFGQQQKS